MDENISERAPRHTPPEHDASGMSGMSGMDRTSETATRRSGRREFLHTIGTAVSTWLLPGATSLLAAPATLPIPTSPRTPRIEGGQAWHDAAAFVEGKAWLATERTYDRLPARAKPLVRPPVWSLSRHSAGMLVRFATDAPTIWARYKLHSKSLAMPHMPATGVSGVDLYARDDHGRWRWAGVSMPTEQNVHTRLAGSLEGLREFMLYLPLYNGVDELEIGVAASAKFTLHAARTQKPLLFYGTSIVHGACASRPGMPHAAIIGRRLGRPVVNLGFSGNGKMEIEIARLLAELDPAVYVLDCLPNMNAKLVAERAAPFVREIRKKRPRTPIVLVEDRTFANAWLSKTRARHHEESRAALTAAHAALRQSGVRGVSYVRGASLLGGDGEATTDGSHPNDLGFVRMADALTPVLASLVGPAAQSTAKG